MFMDYRQDYFHRSFVSELSLRLKFQICGKIRSLVKLNTHLLLTEAQTIRRRSNDLIGHVLLM